MSKFDQFKDTILDDGRKLITSTFKKGRIEAKDIFEVHLLESEVKLKRWTKLLARGDITQSEFKMLVNSQVTLGKMQLRVIKVIGKKSAMEFREKLRELFIDTAFSIFL